MPDKNILLFFSLALVLFSGCTGEEEVSVVKVQLEEGTNMAAALSPDKQTLALDLQGTIWILPVEGGRATPITDAMGDCHEPAWSPDGQRLAFQSYRSGNYDIWTVRRDGTGLEQVTEGIYDDREPAWSPDGGSIVFSSDRNGNYDIWRVDLSTKEVEALTTHDAEDYNPAVSPDGQRIAFVSEREVSGIYVQENEQKTLVAPSILRLAAPSWSDEGNKLLFTGYGRETSHMYLVDLQSDNRVERIVSGEDIFPFRAGWLSWNEILYTADGKIKTRVLGEEKTEQVTFRAEVQLNRRGYDRKQYPFDSRETNEVKGILGPVVSPDGNSIAFTALGDIYLKEFDGSLRQITDDRYVDMDPDWSPDGQKLAYLSDRGGRMQVWLHNLQNDERWLLSADLEGEAAKPSWSPDGKKVAFHTVDYRKKWGFGTLKVADVATGRVEYTHDRLWVPGKPTWSPDGETLALMALDRHSSRFREGYNKFLLVSPADGSSRFVTPDSTSTLGVRNQNGPVWSPDGRKMAYIRDGVLWTVPVSPKGDITGAPEQITEELADNISWTSDSEQLLYLSVDRLKKVNVESGATEEVQPGLEWKQQVPEMENEKVIHAGRLFNGIDSTYREQVDILVAGNRIREIVPHRDHGNAQVIDASGQVVMPGLFEMHSHQSTGVGLRLGNMWLAYGITSVRDPGSDPYDSRERKESWSSGARPGPRLFFTGWLTDGGRIYYGLANSVTKEEHVRMELGRAERLEYSLIKTYVRMPDTIQKTFTEGAHQIGIPLSSHEIYPAAKYNVDATEHLSGTSRRGYSLKLTANYGTYGDVIRLIVRSGMSITPTMGMYGGYAGMAQKYPELLDHEQIRSFHSDEYIGEWRERASGSGFRPNFKSLQETVAAIAGSGGTVTAGTDSPFLPFGSSLHAELWLYVDSGLTPFEALQTATVNAARALGVYGDLGSVEEGKLADLAIVEGNPLDRIQDAMKVRMVVKNGIVYSLDELMNLE